MPPPPRSTRVPTPDRSYANPTRGEKLLAGVFGSAALALPIASSVSRVALSSKCAW